MPFKQVQFTIANKDSPSKKMWLNYEMRIFLKGGLGNQLFQYAYLHNYIILEPGCSLQFIPDSKARSDRPFELSSLLAFCSHTKNIDFGASVYSVPISKYVQNRERLLAVFMHSLTSNHDGTELHERRVFQFSKPKRYQMDFCLPLSGYFQHWKYVESAWDLIEPEIRRQLEFVKSRSHQFAELNLQTIIHIRGGDFHTESATTGALNSDYYVRALDLINRKYIAIGFVLVLTDDVEFATEIMINLNISDYRILGPQDCSAWEALLFMSEAKYLVTANSTLSWWGAFLAKKAGGVSVTPNPWHRNLSGNSKKALGYKGLLSVDSGLEF